MSENYNHVIKIICRCHCGAKLRIPQNATRQYLCPKCYDPVSIEEHATGEAPVIVKEKPKPAPPPLDRFMADDSLPLQASDDMDQFPEFETTVKIEKEDLAPSQAAEPSQVANHIDIDHSPEKTSKDDYPGQAPLASEVQTEPLASEVQTEPLASEVQTEPLASEVQTEPLASETKAILPSNITADPDEPLPFDFKDHLPIEPTDVSDIKIQDQIENSYNETQRDQLTLKIVQEGEPVSPKIETNVDTQENLVVVDLSHKESTDEKSKEELITLKIIQDAQNEDRLPQKEKMVVVDLRDDQKVNAQSQEMPIESVDQTDAPDPKIENKVNETEEDELVHLEPIDEAAVTQPTNLAAQVLSNTPSFSFNSFEQPPRETNRKVNSPVANDDLGDLDIVDDTDGEIINSFAEAEPPPPPAPEIKEVHTEEPITQAKNVILNPDTLSLDIEDSSPEMPSHNREKIPSENAGTNVQEIVDGVEIFMPIEEVE